MEYQKYINEKKKLLDAFHQFIEEENNSEEDFQTLISFIKTEKYEENREEFKLILHMINNISNHHHRSSNFNSKIEQFLSNYLDYIKQQFSNNELFNIFQKNKRILHFLVANGIFQFDENINYFISKKICKDRKTYVSYFQGDRNLATKYFENKKKTTKHYNYYYYYFYPELKNFIDEKKRKQIEKELFENNEFDLKEFDQNRRRGENESKICELIRNDSIKEFIIYVNKNNIKLSSEVKKSIFETNPLLLQNEVSLIEYAAFFGSIEIFQYLRFNNIELKPSLWKYSIHGNNAEIIHLLEENQIKPEGDDFNECLKEAIKCHHNNIANYIIENLICKNDDVNEFNFKENQFSFGFHYHNYEFIQNLEQNQIAFYYACLYDYFNIVKLFVSKNQIDLNHSIILS